MPDGLFIAAEGPFGTVQETGGRRRGRFILLPGQAASLQCYDTTHLLLFWFMANTHLRATSSLKERPCLGLQARQRRAQSLRTFLHVTQHITKPDAQKSGNNVSATIQETSAPAVPFSFYRISPDVAKQR